MSHIRTPGRRHHAWPTRFPSPASRCRSAWSRAAVATLLVAPGLLVSAGRATAQQAPTPVVATFAGQQAAPVVAPAPAFEPDQDLAWPPFYPPLDVEASDPARAATAPLDAPMPRDPRIRVGRLDNGLYYWIRENRYPAQRAELRLVVRAGSMQEDDDQLGLAHFVEHMAFNGTEHFPKLQLVEALESFGMRFGADVNASTSFDETLYFLRIPTDRQEIVDTALQILEDWAHNVTFDDEEIDKERGVVIEEWRLGLGAGSRLRDKQFPILFAGSRYAERSPIGKLEVLQSFPHEALRRFYRDWYRPDLMAVIAVGDFDADAIEAQIAERFGRLAMPEAPRPREYVAVPDHEDTRVSIETDPEATTSAVTVYRKMPLRRQAYHGAYRRKMIENLFLAMLNRRLTEQAQQPNPPYLGAGADQGIFLPTTEVFVLGAAVPDGGVVRGLQAAVGELERVARFGFTETELERQKAQFMTRFAQIYEQRTEQDSGSFAEEFTRAFLEGESTPGIEYEWALYQRFMPGITLAEVNAVARRWMGRDNRVVLVSAPDKPGIELPSESELLAALEPDDDAWIRPYVDTVTDAPLLAVPPEPGEIVQEKRVEELGIVEWRLSNGARVVLKPTDFRHGEILMRAFSPGGTSLASDEDYVAAASAVQVVSASGFGGFSAREITNTLADKVARVRPVMGPLEEGLVGNASPDDLETMLQLLYLTVTEPRADHGVFYLDRFGDVSDFTFVFVGSFDVERMRPLVERYIASLPGHGRQESWRDEGVVPPRGVIRKAVYKGLEPKSLTTIVFSGEHDFDTLPRGAMGAMAEVLQTRLREVLREDLGGTYGVQVNASTVREPRPQYSLSITFGADPERVDALTEVVFEQIHRLQQQDPQQAEVAAVVEQFRRQYELSLKENGYWLGQLVAVYRRGEDPHEIVNYEERLAQITPAAVRAAAQAAFDFADYVQVTLYPESMRPQGAAAAR